MQPAEAGNVRGRATTSHEKAARGRRSYDPPVEGSTPQAQTRFRPAQRGGRLLYDADGHIHAGRLLIGIGATGAVMVLGMYIALVAAGVGNPDILGVGVLVILLGIKLPLLLLVWRLLGRHMDRPGTGRWTAEEHREILARLEEVARTSAGRPDAAARLAHLSREAWGIVDLTPDEGKSDAIAAALRIEQLAGAGGRGPTLAGGPGY
jgi:hypothetical protein